MPKIYLSILFSFVVCLVTAQSKQDKELIKQLDQLISNNFQLHAPGAQVLVAKRGQVIYEKGFGTADLEWNQPLQKETVFRIGSITKEFTAVALLQLAEKGKLSLNDSIQKFIKGFSHPGRPLTIENLLTHTSGIIGYEQLDAGMPNAIRVDFPARLIVDSLSRRALEFEPGTRYQYSNSNYFLLGYILEQLSGISYEQYLQENLFRPAGLTSTYYENYTRLIPQRARGYSFGKETYYNADYISMSLVYSAGALLSNASDLYKWQQALLAGKLLQPQTLVKAFSPYRLVNGDSTAYGYGFFTRTENGIRSIGHGGAIDGFRSMALYYPEQDVFIVCLLNSERDNDARLFRMIEHTVLDIKTASDAKEIRLSGELMDDYAGTYMNNQYKVSIRVYRANGRLYGELSNGTGSYLMFMALSETHFELPDVKRIKTLADFVRENGKVTKLILTQEQALEFLRVE